MTDSTQSIPKNNSEDDFDIRTVLRTILMQSKLILFIVFIFTSLAVILYLNTEKQYKVSSLVQVLSNKDAPRLTQNVTSEFLVGSSGENKVESIKQIYKSRNHLIRVIESLMLNVEIEGIEKNEAKFIKRINYYPNGKTNVEEFYQDYSKKEFTLDLNEQNYTIKDDKENILISAKYGILEDNNVLSTEILKPSEKLVGKNYRIIFENPIKFYRKLLKKFQIIEPTATTFRSFDGGAILEISLITNNINSGIKILNHSNSEFIKRSIENESKQARQVLDFIDSRVENIEEDLNKKKTNLNSFREENKTVDVDLEIESIISSLVAVESKLNEIDLEIENARSTLTETNPIFQTLLNQKTTLLNQKKMVEKEVENLPVAQQKYIDLFGELEISQTIYNILQNRKLEYSLKEASTLGNMRVIDSAYLDYVVSPTIFLIIFTFIFSAIFALIFAIIRGAYFLAITNPAELEDNKIYVPILGVVNKVDENDDTVDSERFKQAIESLIVNVETKYESLNKENEAVIISITSPSAENGKSFISRNTALRFANLGKKVALIDADFKRGDQHKHFNVRKITKNDFFSIKKENIDEYKVKEKDLYFIPKISQLESSFNFLYANQYSETMDFLKREFDIIIIDTAPILSVSDTLILSSFSNISLLVIRHAITRVNEVKQTLTLFSQLGQSPDGIIYNCYEKPSSYYGYYGLYGNYAYQYYSKRYLYDTYDYSNEKD